MARVIVALAMTVMACLVVAPSALASHARPKAASLTVIKQVPAYEECFGTSTGNHGAPVTLVSCNPPLQSSSFLTMNAPERVAPFVGAANGTGSVTLKVTCVSSVNPPVENGETPPCNGTTGDQEDVTVTIVGTDVRCVGAPAQALCAGGVGAAGAGTLYNGKVLVDMPMRITDHVNALTPNPPGADCSDTTTCTGTMTDPVIPMGTQCTNGNCNYTTSLDASIPGLVKEQSRAVVELGQVEFQDAGTNGTLAAAPSPASGACPPACEQDDASTVYLTQGLFAP